MTELTLEERVKKLERSQRFALIVASLALIVALLAKIIAIWAAANRPAPKPEPPPERIAFRATEFPTEDSNLDKLLQRQLCYRYTSGECVSG